MKIFRAKQAPMVIARITNQPYGPTRIDLIPHNFDGLTTSYSTSDGKTFCCLASGAKQEDRKIAAHLRELVAKWKAGFYKDLLIRTA
jgi:hypothetical protein